MVSDASNTTTGTETSPAHNPDSTTSTIVSDERDEALRTAVRRARSDAEALAEAAGGRLGEMLLLQTGPAFDYAGSMMAGAFYGRLSDGDVPLSPSDVTVRVTVSATWRFVEQ